MSIDHIETLVRMASNQRLAELHYRKGVTGGTIKPRLVEPYHFVQGTQSIMVRCYQLQHGEDASESGWRFFMAHKIHWVEETTIEFRPRRKITLPTGAIAEAFEMKPTWEADGRRAYRDVLSGCLADGTLSTGERCDLHQIVQKYKLTDDDVRFVHASTYHHCLGAVIEDGFVSEKEIADIRFLHDSMHKLGWAVGE